MIRVAHSADWHPRSDGTICGKQAIDPNTGLSRTLTDFKDSLEWMWRTILERRVQLLLLAGDIFDTNKPSMDEFKIVLPWLLRAAEQMPVVLIPGNHDLAQSGALASAVEPIKSMGKIFVVERPQTIKLNFEGTYVNIDCLPYPTRGRLLAQQEGKPSTAEETNAKINEGLQAILRGFEPQAHQDPLEEETTIHILMAHGSVAEARVGDQPRSLAHDIMIPIPPAETSRYHYVALGHIHQPQSVRYNAFYCGSLMRQSFGEENEHKGFMTADLALGEKTASTFIENPHARKYQTFSVEEVLLGGAIPSDVTGVYRIKGEILEEEWPKLEPVIRHWTDSLPFVQVSVEVVKENRLRDSHMNQQMSLEEALDRSLEREGIVDPVLTRTRELHRQLIQEVV